MLLSASAVMGVRLPAVRARASAKPAAIKSVVRASAKAPVSAALKQSETVQVRHPGRVVCSVRSARRGLTANRFRQLAMASAMLTTLASAPSAEVRPSHRRWVPCRRVRCKQPAGHSRRSRSRYEPKTLTLARAGRVPRRACFTRAGRSRPAVRTSRRPRKRVSALDSKPNAGSHPFCPRLLSSCSWPTAARCCSLASSCPCWAGWCACAQSKLGFAACCALLAFPSATRRCRSLCRRSADATPCATRRRSTSSRPSSGNCRR